MVFEQHVGTYVERAEGPGADKRSQVTMWGGPQRKDLLTKGKPVARASSILSNCPGFMYFDVFSWARVED